MNARCPPSFDEFWRELISLLKQSIKVKTICKENYNHIVNITSNFIVIESSTGNERRLYERYFEQVYTKVIAQKRVFLRDFPDLRKRRVSSIVFALMALHPCMHGECIDGKTVLEIKQ